MLTFNLERLLLFLERVGHSTRELDVAFCDDQGITRHEDWLRVLISGVAFLLSIIGIDVVI